MALYMYQGAYTAESIAAQIKNPQDRLEAVRPAIQAFGGKLIAGGFTFGEYDVVAIIEAPNETSMAALALSIAAGGAIRAGKTTGLLSGQEWVTALKQAGASGSAYRPAR
jgi:uncharacterized protein with GYD domain